MEIGARGEEWREVLRRIWWRQGGSDETFEQMIPPTAARPPGKKPDGRS
jgi:hypothetical protein